MRVKNQVLTVEGGKLVVGATAAQEFPSSSFTPTLQVNGLGNSDSLFGAARWSNDTSAAILRLMKSRGTAVGTKAAVQDGDSIGNLSWFGYGSSTVANQMGKIEVFASGNQSGTVQPSVMKFYVNLGAADVTEVGSFSTNGFFNCLALNVVGNSFLNGDVYSAGFAQIEQGLTALSGFTSTTIGDTFLEAGGTTDAVSSISAVRYGASATPPRVIFVKNRHSVQNNYTIVANNDGIGKIQWEVSNGSGLFEVASIRAEMAGTISSSALPTRIRMAVTPAGSTTPVDTMYITPSSQFGWNIDPTTIAASLGTPIATFAKSGATASAEVVAYDNANGNVPRWVLARGVSGGVVNGSVVGGVDFRGLATTWFTGAKIEAVAEGTWASNDAPCGLRFYTTVDNGSSPTLRYQITNAGRHLFGNPTDDGSTAVQVTGAILASTNVTATSAFYTGGKFESTGGDTRMLMSGGGTTKALTLNYSAALDATGNLTFQRRTNADSFEAVVGGYLVGAAQWFWGASGTVTNALVTTNGQSSGYNFCSPLTAKGTITTTVTVDWRDSESQTFTMTASTNPTVTFTAPCNCCVLTLKVVAPASTTPTITWPATVKGSPPTTVTAAKVTVLMFWWDGTNYYYMASCQNV